MKRLNHKRMRRSKQTVLRHRHMDGSYRRKPKKAALGIGGCPVTPEERADRIVASWCKHSLTDDEGRHLIAAAIRAAIEAEREGCARTAEKVYRDEPDGIYRDCTGCWAANERTRRIAAAIRRRKT